MAQPAVLVPESKLVDAPPHGQPIDDVLNITRDYELVIMHTSTSSLAMPREYDTLKQLRDNGLRLLLVGFESGNQQILNHINNGIKLDIA